MLQVLTNRALGIRDSFDGKMGLGHKWGQGYSARENSKASFSERNQK
jgi:hypothetical protein